MSLDALLIKGPLPTAEKQNALLAHLQRQRLTGLSARFAAPATFPHPWRVRVARFEPPKTSPLKPDTAWRIDVSAGLINDQLPTILYLRANDPRGWSIRAGYVEPANPQSAIRNPQWIERDQLDDPDDPPALVVLDPPSADFERITDEERPRVERGAFCGAADWDLELWRTHVALTAGTAVSGLFSALFPPPRILRYRLRTSAHHPPPNFGANARAGGAFVLATLYLLRDPARPAEAVLLRRQEEWWPLWAVIAQPGRELTAIGIPLLTNLDETATVEAWTV